MNATARRIETLEEEIERLRQRLEISNRAIEDRAANDAVLTYPRAWKLRGQPLLLMEVLMTQKLATSSAICHAFYKGKRIPDGWGEHLKVVACKLRKILRQHGIEFDLVYGVGYALSPAMKDAVRRACREAQEAGQ